MDLPAILINNASAIAKKFNEYFADLATNLNQDVNKDDSVYRDKYVHRKFMSSFVAYSIFLTPVTPHDVHRVIKITKIRLHKT